MAQTDDKNGFAGTAALVFFGFFALVIATSAAGRWLANLGPEPVVIRKAAPPPAATAPAPTPAPPETAPAPAAPDAPAPSPPAPTP